MQLPFKTLAVLAVLGTSVVGSPFPVEDLEARNPEPEPYWRGGGGGAAAAAAASGGGAAAAAAAAGGRNRFYARDVDDNFFVYFDGVNDNGRKGFYKYTKNGLQKIDYNPVQRYRLNFFPFFGFGNLGRGNFDFNRFTSGSSSPFAGNFNPFSIFRGFPFGN